MELKNVEQSKHITRIMSAVFITTAYMQLKLDKEYHLLLRKQVDQKIELNLKRHRIHVNTEPKIVSIEKKDRPEKSCVEKSIIERAAIECEKTQVDTNVKNKINFFNQMASGPNTVPKRRQINVVSKSFNGVRFICSNCSMVQRHSTESSHLQIGIVKQNQQRFSQNIDKDMDNKPISDPIALPFTAVPVKLRIASIEGKSFK